ncbi:MAG: VCBS repeat-containing protein [candidate division KSB1 bacterium]|nr:VCBS repeat-containing protein [candidate division KSB1 bacterium]MDZ7365885.1 VCBS repeat-containing protein [candidate division KSB1 bacterium]MDZ7403880.1 VCBS repeat-containing protein [candidate division KSB1 bacterium]
MLILTACERTQFPPGHLFHPTSKPVAASPLVVDLDRDDKPEIAVGDMNGDFYLLDDSLRVLQSWSPPSSIAKRGFHSSAAAWDVDRDPHPEIFVASENGKLFGWRFHSLAAAPALIENFPVVLGGPIWSSPTIIADSLIAIGGFKKMFVLDRQGNPAPGWPQPIEDWAEATAAWHGDVLTIATLTPGETSRGRLYVWHLNGRLYPNFPINVKMDSDTSPALADLDNDGRVEIIVGDDAGLLHVFTLDGSELPGFPRLAGHRIESSPTVVDLDANGLLDIIVGADDGYVYAWSAVGDVLLGWPVKTNDEVRSAASVADIDGDGRLEVIIASLDHHLYAFRQDGALVPKFPIDCGNKISSSPWVGDLDGDGQTDIVIGADNGVHRLCNIGKLGAAPWPMFRRDISHTGALVKF